MQSGSGSIALKQNSAVSVYIGIASLVLEGRQISTDEDDNSFSIKFDSAPNKTFSDESRAAETVGSTGGSSSSRQGVIHRIGEKLMRLRQFPGSNKDVVEPIAIPTQSREDCEYERQPRLLHVASAREFHRSPRLAPTSTASSSTSATSVLHDIDVDWNDISILFNGLDSLINLPGSPIKLPSSHTFRASLAGHHPMYSSDTSASLFKNKEKPANKGTVKPKQGPHCEKFLKKIGILKTDPTEADTVHMCNHVSDYCRRWQFHLKKMMQILSKGEDACIEVYLGPENNAILLEQWTFKLTNEPSPTTMTIQALCSAIRSQLYFSQVSSWVDLLKKTFVGEGSNVKEHVSNLFSPEIMQNPRLKKNLETMQVDLDILFRIKSHDGASCFNDKPNVHNFPDTLVSDRMALRVCLKSLPRLDKIPTLNTEKANINGFSCDNRIKVSLGVSAPLGSPVAGSSFHLLNDRVSPAWCLEKGKHRCKHEDEEECDDENLEEKKTPIAKSFTAQQQAASASHTPKPTSPIPLSHRERQLLKYKKRLMKRDKQKKKVQEGDQTSVSSLNTSGSDEFEKFQKTAINDTFAPLYSSKGGSLGTEKINITATTTSATLVNKQSIATQTEHPINDDVDDDSSFKKCDNCGEDLQCRNCDKNQISLKNQTTTSLSVNIGSVVGTMIGNKADLLLQAIQRTANAHHIVSTGVVKLDNGKESNFVSPKSHRGESFSPIQSIVVTDERSETCDTIIDNNNYLTNNNNVLSDDCRKIGVQQETDCRLCKRQKTKHNYSPLLSASTSSSIGSYRRTMSECLVGMSPEGDDTDGAMSCHSPLPVHNCDDAEFNYASNATSLSVDDALSYGCLKSYRRAFSEDVINQLPAELCCFEPNEDDDNGLTLKCNHCSHGKTKMESPAALKLTPNVNLQQGQYLNTTPSHKKVYNQKIPKINLSHLFDNIQFRNDSGSVPDTVESPTSDSVFPFNSYPPTPNQLSPRMSSGTYSLMKRRSRNISDRSSISEYSNISDEDEDIAKVTTEPPDARRASSSTKISSLYKKFVIKTHAAFNKLPLLGTIEESLLRDRFQPKAIVNGFKLLLGASGSFCPTQLTIPAQTFCYEFQGIKHMSTPYVCEFRLARKGYSIPPTGTVQATLLNPQGTVVRMFFVPYDFRDMPAMSQTFIRQRVLAIDEHVSQKEAEQMSTVEQMKHLRYLIHLKFQTGRTGRLCLHTDLKLLISRRTEFDTAQAHAKNSLESPNDLKTISISPENPKFSSRIDKN